MRVYLCGPMSGIDQMNFPAFDEAAADLRRRGYEVVSPAELDSPESREAALASDGDISDYQRETGESWGDLLARDVRLLADGGIEGIVCLDGWPKSRGARLETFVARLCGLPILHYSPQHGYLWPVGEDLLIEVHGTLPEGAQPEDAVLDPGATRSDMRHASVGLADRLKRIFGESGNVHDETWGEHLDDEDDDCHLCGGPCEATDEEVAEETRQFFGEERVTNATTGGQKGTKPEKMELIPYDVLMRDVAPLYAFGAAKYAAHNYRKGYDWSLSFGAMMRHAAQFWHGEDVDEESGCPHLASVVFHALALLLFAREHPELDDRP